MIRAQKLHLNAIVVTLITFELFVVLALYRFNLFGLFEIQLAQNFCVSYVFSDNLCATLSGVPPAILLTGFALALLSRLLPSMDHRVSIFVETAELTALHWALLFCNAVGILLIAAPFFIVLDHENSGRELLQALWVMGVILAMSPLLIFGFQSAEIFKRLRLRHVPIVAFIAIAPELTAEIDEWLWLETSLQLGTMMLVITLLDLIGEVSFFVPPETVGINQFSVWIGSPCAGLSGIFFSASLVALFLVLSSQVIRTQRAIFLIPVAALLSWLMNSVRITALLLIGEYISPELAVDGFHSYAGWIAIVLTSSLMMYATVKITWFHKVALSLPQTQTTFFLSPAASYVLPFFVFMFTLLIFGALSPNPDALYPVRISIVALCLLLFIRHVPNDIELPGLEKSGVLPAVVLAFFWVWFGSSEVKTIEQVLPEGSQLQIFVWILFRIFGTVIVVPIVEELFFRGYLQPKLSEVFRNQHWVAIACTATIFALLHENIILAFAAGVLFGVVRMRTGSVGSAVLCHSIANSAIAVFALFSGNWALI